MGETPCARGMRHAERGCSYALRRRDASGASPGQEARACTRTSRGECRAGESAETAGPAEACRAHMLAEEVQAEVGGDLGVFWGILSSAEICFVFLVVLGGSLLVNDSIGRF